MNLIKMLTRVGSMAFETAVPGGKEILQGINKFLPDDKKLPVNATGQDIAGSLSHVPEADRAALMSREYDVKETEIKEAGETLRTMLVADSINPQSMRPKIAWWSFIVSAIISLSITGVIVYSAIKSDDPLATLKDSWQLILVLNGTYVGLLYAYFGIMRKEHEAKLNASGGHPTSGGVLGLIGNMLPKK